MKVTYHNKIRLTAWIFMLSIFSVQAIELDSLNRDPEYVNAIIERSKKIVEKLDIADVNVCNEVTKIITNRYFELNDIYEKRDAAIKTAKEVLRGEAKDNAIKASHEEVDAALYRSHFAFPAALSLWLTEKQVEEVKDGMTYHVVHVTYTAQLDMIPTLKEEEKKQIYAWLTEAREFAIDAESSKKKHEVFGKYKGRINNYLSKRGYDLAKEREGWAKRVKARGGTL